MFLLVNNILGGEYMEHKDKNIRIAYDVWCLLYVKTTELTVRTGKLVTIKSFVSDLVLKELKKEEKV